MGYNHPEILESNPYYDDFSDTKKFLRVLFKPGYAVQARELTQLQTLLQNQIAKFGSHIFKDGSQVFGGGITLSDANFLRTSVSLLTSTSDSVNDLKGKILTQGSSDSLVRAKVLFVIEKTSADPYTILILQYLTGNQFVSSTTSEITIENYNSSITVSYDNTVTEATGNCQYMTVETGIFYVDGFFVTNDAQSVVLKRMQNGVNKFTDAILTQEGVTNRVGFEIERTVIDVTDDTTLNDPARGFYNYNAPGADRYVINLNLVAQEFDPASVEPGEFVTQDFVELARTVKGSLDYVKKVPTYGELVDTLARRTYDESGNYTVKPFELEVKNHYRNDVYSLFIRFDDTTYANSMYVGDYIATLNNGSPDKIGIITSISTYTPTTDEMNATALASELPTHIIKVTRESVNDTYDYTFFTSNDDAYHRNVVGNINVSLGKIKRVTASRDPDGVYSPEGEGGTDEKYVLSVKPGKAYVFGYEFETINNTNIVVDKAREDSIVSVNGYNLGSDIGNYFIVSANEVDGVYKFNNWYTAFNLEEMPYMKFGGRYIRITIPYQAEDKRSFPCKYWSPLPADQSSSFRSVAFVTTDVALTTESIAGHSDINDTTNYLNLIDFSGEAASTDGTHDAGYVRPQNTVRTQSKYIGGGTSLSSYEMINMSNDVEINISRLVFTDPWHGDIPVAYDSGSEDNNIDSTYSTTVYPIKQIKCLDTANPTSIQVTTGYGLRWVPASSSGASSSAGSTLFVKVVGSVDFNGSTETESAHFSLDDGIVFTDPATTSSPISYGSSIAYVVRETNAKRIIVRNATDLGCISGASCTDEGQGGFYSVGDIVTQNYTKDGVEVQATGEILAIGGNFQTPNSTIELYIQTSGVNQIYGVNDPEIGTAGITDLGCLVGPCGLYKPRSSVSLNSPTCGELVRIGFKDSENVGGYTANETAFQYNYLALEEIAGVPKYLDVNLVKGRVVSWDEKSKELIVLETQGRFEVANGTVYQLSSGTNGQVKYGGRGWDKYKTKYAKTANGGIDIYDIEKVSGIFIDIAGSASKNFAETAYSVFDNTTYGKGELITQVAIPSLNNYVEGKDFTTNEEIYQTISSTETARGIVLSWTHKDPTNPADTSDTIMIIQPTNSTSFVVGNPSAVNRPIKSSVSSDVSYDVSAINASKTKEIIGCGRIRLLRRQEQDAYQAFFFDIKMDYLPDMSRRYNLNEVSEFYYEDSFKNTILNDFEDQDIQLSSTTAESDYVFTVHPTLGIDSTASTEYFVYSKVYDTDINSLIFRLPGSEVVKNVGEMDYRIQRQFKLSDSADFGTTSLVFDTEDPFVRFIGGESSTTGKVDSNDLLEHYTLILSTSSNEYIEDLASGNYTITTNNYSSPTSNSTFTITRKDSSIWRNTGLISAQLIATLNVNPSTNAYRTKRIRRFTETVTLKKTKNGFWKALLSRADIIAIDKITAVSSTTDVKEQFDLYNGQTDNSYDLGQIILKNEYLENNVPAFANYQVIVSYRFFLHAGDGPLTKNSYSSIDYKDIPYYTSPSTGQTYKLDSVIDLRPVKTSVGELMYKWMPAPASSFNVDYEYYLGRAYKLAITRDLNFKLIGGIPAFDPQLPPDDENAMTIYDIIVEPYIYDRNGVSATMINNRRYTMKDIMGLDERIQTLEKFTVLNSLESKAEINPVVDTATQLPRVVSSIFVDNFANHSKGDTINIQYNASVDPEENLIRPSFKMHSIEVEQSTSSNTVKSDDNVVMLNYSETPMITQLSSSGVEKINPFNDISWIGTLKITPSTDSWFDTTVQPDVRYNENNINDAVITVTPSTENNNNTGMGMEFNFWNKRWHANRKKKKKHVGYMGWATRRKGLHRGTIKGVTQNEKPVSGDTSSANKINVGENKVVDRSVVPFIREKTITAVAEGLRPYSVVYVFFDDVDITSQCQIYNSVGQSVYTGGLRTDSKGSLQFTFTIEQGKFKTGEKLLVVTDSSSNDANNATTIAETTYVAQGAIEVATDKFISTRKPAKKPAFYTKNTSDPVAQTFFVDSNLYPEGVFVSSVDVFFAAKDAVLPVTLEIRPTSNGYPLTRNQTTVYPFASVVKYPSQIVVSDTANSSTSDTKTTFTFSTPVHLLPGEHAIVLKSNSSDYSVYVAEVGQLLTDSTSRIAQQAAVGSFFKTQNAGRWQAYENIDLMFNINRCEFIATTGTITLSEIVDATKSSDSFETYTVNNDEIKFNGTDMQYAIRTTLASSSTIQANAVSITPNTNIKLDASNKVNYTGNSLELVVTLTSNSNVLSPVFDTDRLNIIGVQNLIENNTNLVKTSDGYNGELEPRTPVVADETSRVRYITKIVELEKGFESTNIKATFSCNIPADTKIQVFLKQQAAGKDSPFDDEMYIQMSPDKPDYISPDENTFEDIVFSLPSDLPQAFSKFAIKVCMYSSNPVKVPQLKEMRIVSVI